MSRPFVYIAGLIRTGSTALSEALHHPPEAVIIREPRLGTNRIVLRDADRATLTDLGLDADRALSRQSLLMGALRAIGKGGHPSGGAGTGHASGYAARVFRDRLARPLAERVQQVGIKEVRHDGWEHVIAAFPDVRVVAIARDPRDMYLSHRGRVLKKGNPLPTPEAFADEIARQFDLQRALIDATDSLTIRYEDLCQDPAVLDRVREHVQSPVTGSGTVGQFTAQNALRARESELHGADLTDSRVGRWRRETDADALAAAHRVHDRLGAFTTYWRYGPDGPLPRS
ncbi:MAG: sulfotransferase [Bacteroidota bacterium]